MSKLIFTPEQIQILKANPYVKNVSEKVLLIPMNSNATFFQNH